MIEFEHCRPQHSTALFFQYNQSLGPPYRILLDTNFINFSIQNKLEVVQAAMDCLFAKCKQPGCVENKYCQEKMEKTNL